MIRVALRLDGPSETSHQGVGGILDMLNAHQACATFAAIPFRMIEDQRVALSQSRAHPLVQAERAGVIEAALHGPRMFDCKLSLRHPASSWVDLGIDSTRSLPKAAHTSKLCLAAG